MEKSVTETELQGSADKLAYWAQHFLEWEQSFDSQSDFCKNRNLSHAKFCYWRYYVKRAMRQQKSKQTENKQFVPVTIKANQPMSLFDYSCGRHLLGAYKVGERCVAFNSTLVQ